MDLKKILNRYLTIDDITKIDGVVTKRNIFLWIKKGKKIRDPVTHEWKKESVKLKTLKLKSNVLISPENLVTFFKKTGQEELINSIPSYLRK